jgi:preprotein translocase subunit SecF
LELIKPGTKFDFIGRRRLAYLISGALTLIALIALVRPGVKLGVEFRGGWEMEVSFDRSVGIEQLRAALAASGNPAFQRTEIQQLGSASQRTYLLRASGEVDARTLERDFEAAVAPLGKPVVHRFELVGARVGSDLLKRGILAMVLALGAILVYVAVRFPWRFAPGVGLALVHDVIVSLGFVTLLGREFTLPVLAALLALIGFSTNDTIVVYDRIRENLRRRRRPELGTLMNLSINETLSRTLLTSGTVLVASLCLLAFGGPVLRDMALVLTVGVIAGSYSSIFVAGAVTLEIERRWPGPKF